MKGGVELIDEYIEKYGRRLYGLCITLCADRFDADDLYQETWIKAYKKLHLYDEKRPFEGWLTGICVNTYRDYLRKKKLYDTFNAFGTSDEKKKCSEWGDKILTEYILYRIDGVYNVSMEMTQTGSFDAPEVNFMCEEADIEQWEVSPNYVSYFSCLADEECNVKVYTNGQETEYILEETESNIDVYGLEPELPEVMAGEMVGKLSVYVEVADEIDVVNVIHIDSATDGEPKGYSRRTGGNGKPVYEFDYAAYQVGSIELLKLTLMDAEENILLEYDILSTWKSGDDYQWKLQVHYDENGKLAISEKE